MRDSAPDGHYSGRPKFGAFQRREHYSGRSKCGAQRHEAFRTSAVAFFNRSAIAFGAPHFNLAGSVNLEFPSPQIIGEALLLARKDAAVLAPRAAAS
jgi:hypothetical protein